MNLTVDLKKLKMATTKWDQFAPIIRYPRFIDSHENKFVVTCMRKNLPLREMFAEFAQYLPD